MLLLDQIYCVRVKDAARLHQSTGGTQQPMFKSRTLDPCSAEIFFCMNHGYQSVFKI